MVNRFETYFVAYYAYFYCQTTPILKTLWQFENLVFVIFNSGKYIYPFSLELLISAKQIESISGAAFNVRPGLVPNCLQMLGYQLLRQSERKLSLEHIKEFIFITRLKREGL